MSQDLFTGIATGATIAYATHRLPWRRAASSFYLTLTRTQDQGLLISMAAAFKSFKEEISAHREQNVKVQEGVSTYEVQYKIGNKQKRTIYKKTRQRPCRVLEALDENEKSWIEDITQYADSDGVIRGDLLTPGYLGVEKLEIELIDGKTFSIKATEPISDIFKKTE